MMIRVPLCKVLTSGVVKRVDIVSEYFMYLTYMHLGYKCCDVIILHSYVLYQYIRIYSEYDIVCIHANVPVDQKH